MRTIISEMVDLGFSRLSWDPSRIDGARLLCYRQGVAVPIGRCDTNGIIWDFFHDLEQELDGWPAFTIEITGEIL